MLKNRSNIRSSPGNHTSSYLLKKFHGFNLLTLAFITVLCATLQVSGKTAVSSYIDKSKVRLGEDIVFTLRITGSEPSLTQPILPPVEGFKVTGTYQTMEHTADGTAILFHYLLSPEKTGKLTVPPLTLKIGGDTITAPGFTVEVESTRPRPLVRPPKPHNTDVKPKPASLGRNVFLEGRLSSRSAYVGEPVIYTLHLLTRRSVRGLGPVQPPDMEGFRRVDDPLATKSRSYQVRRNGLTYLDAIVIRSTLFPLKPGRLPIGSFSAEINVEAGPLGGRTKTVVEGGQAVLDVKPLPPPPPDFQGAVGAFTLNIIESPPAKTAIGRPFSVVCLVRGRGFLPENPIKVSESPFLTAYPPSEEDSSKFKHGDYGVERKIRVSFVPKVAGPIEFPPLDLVYFDPSEEAYRTLSGGGARVDVEGTIVSGEKSVDITPIIKKPIPGPKSLPSIPVTLFWILLTAPFAANLILALSLWIFREILGDEEKKHIRELKYRARKELFRARRNLDVRKSKDFYQHLSGALRPSMDLITGKMTGGMSRERLGRCLEEAGISLSSRTRLLELVEALEKERYAPVLHTKQEMNATYKSVAWWVKEACRA